MNEIIRGFSPAYNSNHYDSKSLAAFTIMGWSDFFATNIEYDTMV